MSDLSIVNGDILEKQSTYVKNYVDAKDAQLQKTMDELSAKTTFSVKLNGTPHSSSDNVVDLGTIAETSVDIFSSSKNVLSASRGYYSPDYSVGLTGGTEGQFLTKSGSSYCWGTPMVSNVLAGNYTNSIVTSYFGVNSKSMPYAIPLFNVKVGSNSGHKFSIRFKINAIDNENRSFTAEYYFNAHEIQTSNDRAFACLDFEQSTLTSGLNIPKWNDVFFTYEQKTTDVEGGGTYTYYDVTFYRVGLGSYDMFGFTCDYIYGNESCCTTFYSRGYNSTGTGNTQSDLLSITYKDETWKKRWAKFSPYVFNKAGRDIVSMASITLIKVYPEDHREGSENSLYEGLKTTSKSLVGAINELADKGGGGGGDEYITNKVSSITEDIKDSTVKYPSVKAVMEQIANQTTSLHFLRAYTELNWKSDVRAKNPFQYNKYFYTPFFYMEKADPHDGVAAEVLEYSMLGVLDGKTAQGFADQGMFEFKVQKGRLWNYKATNQNAGVLFRWLGEKKTDVFKPILLNVSFTEGGVTKYGTMFCLESHTMKNATEARQSLINAGIPADKITPEDGQFQSFGAIVYILNDVLNGGKRTFMKQIPWYSDTANTWTVESQFDKSVKDAWMFSAPITTGTVLDTMGTKNFTVQEVYYPIADEGGGEGECLWEEGSGDGALVQPKCQSTQQNSASGMASLAIGSNNNADGHFSFVGGMNNTAKGTTDVVIGQNNQTVNTNSGHNFIGGMGNNAKGSFNAVFGQNQSVSGDGFSTFGRNNSISGGSDSVVIGGDNSAKDIKNSLVVGKSNGTQYEINTSNSLIVGQDNSISGGAQSVANGYQNVVQGSNAHAEGASTSALTNASHTNGQYTIASGVPSEFACGDWNNSVGGASGTIFSVGIGTTNSRKNGLDVRKNGDIHIQYEGEDAILQDLLGGGGGGSTDAITAVTAINTTGADNTSISSTQNYSAKLKVPYLTTEDGTDWLNVYNTTKNEWQKVNVSVLSVKV